MSITYRQYYWLLTVLLLLHSALLRAQSEDERSEKKSLTVLIDEGRFEKTLIGDIDTDVTSSAYSIIEAERFRHHFVSLPEVLAQEVGVQVRLSGGEGSFSSLVLRGASSEQVVIYLDGIALNDASGGPVDLSMIPLDNVERIEIYRGSTPLELGDPSIGGAVNIITKRLDSLQSDKEYHTNQSQVSATIASFDTYKLSGSTDVRINNHAFYAGVNYLQSKNNYSFTNDNGTPFNLQDDKVEQRNNDAVEHFAGLAKWKYKINATTKTEFRLDFSDRNKEIPSVTNSSDVQTFVDSQSINILAQINKYRFIRDDVNLNAKIFIGKKDEVFDDSLAQIGFFNQRQESQTKEYGVQIFSEWKKNHQHWKLITGYKQESYDLESSLLTVSSDTNKRSQFDLALEGSSYLLEQQLILQLIVRQQILEDRIAHATDEFGDEVTGFDKQYQFFDPQFGLRYRFSNATYITANVGHYNRAPSFVELFGGGGVLLGNPDLLAEKSVNTDIGYTYTVSQPYHWLHNSQLYLGAFHNRIDDLIVRIYNGQGVGVAKNISQAEVTGFESTIKLQPSVRHSFSLNMSIIGSENTSSITGFNGKKLPGYYRKSFLLNYSYLLQRWLLRLEADVKRDVFYDRANLLKGDDVNLLNVGVRYLMENSTVDFSVNNLFDENIQYFRNRPTPGLNASLTYTAAF